MKTFNFAQQSGAVLLLLVVPALAVLAALTSLQWQLAPSLSAREAERVAQAAAALQHFAVTYTDHYASDQAAGPGRLPCPANRQSRYPHSPSPPCANAAQRLGGMPLRINRLGLSFAQGSGAFANASDLDYWVSERFVNNPARGALNPLEPETELQWQGHSVAAVVLVNSTGPCGWSELVQGGELRIASACRSRVRFILAEALLQRSARRVAQQLSAWLASGTPPKRWFYRNQWPRVLCRESAEALLSLAQTCSAAYRS